MREQVLDAVFLAAQPSDAGKRVKNLRFYSGAQVDRWDWNSGAYKLSFSMDPKHIDLSRLNDGAPLLRDHMPYTDAQIGVVEKGWLDAGSGFATVRFSDNTAVDDIWNDVTDGIIRNVSMGAVINNMSDVTPKGAEIKEYLAIDWQPNHIAIVPIGADQAAQFLSAINPATIQQFLSMSAAKEAAKKNISKPGAAREEERERLNLWLSLRK